MRRRRAVNDGRQTDAGGADRRRPKRCADQVQHQERNRPVSTHSKNERNGRAQAVAEPESRHDQPLELSDEGHCPIGLLLPPGAAKKKPAPPRPAQVKEELIPGEGAEKGRCHHARKVQHPLAGQNRPGQQEAFTLHDRPDV